MGAFVQPGIFVAVTAATACACSTFAKVSDHKAVTGLILLTCAVSKLGENFLLNKVFPNLEKLVKKQRAFYNLCRNVLHITTLSILYALAPRMKAKLPPFFETAGIYGISFVAADIVDWGVTHVDWGVTHVDWGVTHVDWGVTHLRKKYKTYREGNYTYV